MINLKTIYGFKSFIECTDNLLNVDLFFAVDNRKIDDENVFIAIVGEKYNPLKDLEKLRDTGCRFVVYEKNDENDKLVEPFKKFLVFISVENIEQFVEEAGKAVASTFRTRGGKIIAISGSNGKTTTKEMLFHLLSNQLEENEVICTQKNNNNHLGVPFTLFQIRKQTRYAVVELGSNHPGEIEVLAKILYPQFAVTTNIGDSHLEFFHTRENVCKEESVIADYTSDIFYLNSDDKLLSKLNVKNAKSFGEAGKDLHFKMQLNAVAINDIVFENKYIVGKHNFFNLGVALSIAKDALNCKLADLANAAASFKPTANRSQWLELDNKNIFLDAYNANPSSMLAAIEGFLSHIAPIGAKPAETCLVLGDMNELGDNAGQFHTDLAEKLNKHDVDLIIFVGRYKNDFAKGYKGNLLTFNTAAEIKADFAKHTAQHKYLMFKASRTLQLETILDIR